MNALTQIAATATFRLLFRYYVWVLHSKFDRYEPLESNQPQMNGWSSGEYNHKVKVKICKLFTATKT